MDEIEMNGLPVRASDGQVHEVSLAEAERLLTLQAEAMAITKRLLAKAGEEQCFHRRVAKTLTAAAANFAIHRLDWKAHAILFVLAVRFEDQADRRSGPAAGPGSLAGLLRATLVVAAESQAKLMACRDGAGTTSRLNTAARKKLVYDFQKAAAQAPMVDVAKIGKAAFPPRKDCRNDYDQMVWDADEDRWQGCIEDSRSDFANGAAMRSKPRELYDLFMAMLEEQKTEEALEAAYRSYLEFALWIAKLHAEI